MAQNFALDEEPPEEDWLTTYADTVTLLMCFFVMLVAMSKIDVSKYEQVMQGIQNEMGQKEFESPTRLLKVDVEDVVYAMGADQFMTVGTDDRGVVIELASSAFYKPGSADIRAEAIPLLQKMTQALKAPRYRAYTIAIEGHTDDDPINTVVFPSNWELSAARATRVARFMIEQGVNPVRLQATGFAETRPKVPNRDAKGVAIPENQAVNRRVIIRVFPMDIDEGREIRRAPAPENVRQILKSVPAPAQPVPASPTSQAPMPSAPAAASAPVAQGAAPRR